MGYYCRVSSFQVMSMLVKVNRKTKWKKIIRKKKFKIVLRCVSKLKDPNCLSSQMKIK